MANVLIFFSKRIASGGHISKNWYTERAQAIVENMKKYKGPQLKLIHRRLNDIKTSLVLDTAR